MIVPTRYDVTQTRDSPNVQWCTLTVLIAPLPHSVVFEFFKRVVIAIESSPQDSMEREYGATLIALCRYLCEYRSVPDKKLVVPFEDPLYENVAALFCALFTIPGVIECSADERLQDGTFEIFSCKWRELPNGTYAIELNHRR